MIWIFDVPQDKIHEVKEMLAILAKQNNELRKRAYTPEIRAGRDAWCPKTLMFFTYYLN